MTFSRGKMEAGAGWMLLGLLLAMLVFAPLAFGAVDEWAFLVVQGLGAGLLLVWAGRLWLNPKPEFRWPPLAWVVVAFTVYAAARYFTADIEIVARQEVLQVLLLALVFLAILDNFHGGRQGRVIGITLIMVATGISGYAVGQMVAHTDRVWNVYSGYAGRAGGTYISPNDLAGLLGMVLPLALGWLLAGRMKVAVRILLAGSVLVLLAGLCVTFSRAGWVATGAGILLVLGLLIGHRQHRAKALVLLMILLVGGGFFVTRYLSRTATFQERVFNVNQAGAGVFDIDTRLALWRSARQMWEDHFWFGVGPAHFDYRFSEYRPAIIQKRPNRTHNDYLNLLADWGTVGGLLVLTGMGVFAAGWLKTWSLARRGEGEFAGDQSNRFGFFIGASGGLCSLAIHSAADFNLHIPANALVGVTLLALLAGNMRPASERFRGWAPKLGLTGALAAAILILAVDGWRRGQETYWLAQAEKIDPLAPTKVTLLAKAFQAEPKNFQTAYEIGESLRLRSFQGDDDNVELGQKALDWFATVIRLDPYNGYGFMGTGMCLDWLGKTAQSGPDFEKAEALDPNGYFMVANIGWHYVQIGDYAMAREYFIRSLRLSNANPFAQNYLDICEQKLVEKASGRPLLPFGN